MFVLFLDEPVIKYITKDESLHPIRGTPYAAGEDLYSSENYTLEPGKIVKINTGVQWRVPRYMKSQIHGEIHLRSSSRIHGLTTNGVGILDSDYTGDIFVFVWSDRPSHIMKGERIAQLVIITHDNTSNEFIKKHRGESGSTGSH